MAIRRTFFFDGLGVSPGVVLGPAHVIEPQGFETESYPLKPEEVELEIERFHRALDQARDEVQELGRTVAERIDAQQAAIFEAHHTLLSDPLLIDRTLERIRQDRKNAEFVFWRVTHDIGEQLSALGDAYFSERTHDIYDVARRVLKFLTLSKHPGSSAIPAGAIIVAIDLGPSETAQLQRDRIAGFVTSAGGPTSHTAIMAKALALPAVVGLDLITHYVRNNDFLILDGTEGKVILNPTDEMIAYYRELAEEYERGRANLTTLRDLPAETLDGARVRLEANIEFANELDLVLNMGAEGIGLFRTEYFFIGRECLPTEEEQEAAYFKVLQALGDTPVVFRTLDVGGDKIAANLAVGHEANPFLGLRALRLCLAHPELFRLQLRPMLRAARGKDLYILLPMVSCIDEVIKAKAIIREVYERLEEEGAEMPASVKVGAMVEIPSAALQADVLAREVDFFSIGTNDLVQYTLAVDRVNKLVGHLYHETHPAVLQLIAEVVRAGRQHNKPVTVCGEMAGDPMLSLLLLGLGVRTLSMSPSLIGAVKKSVRSVEMSYLTAMAEELLKLASPIEVREALKVHLAPFLGTASHQRAGH